MDNKHHKIAAYDSIIISADAEGKNQMNQQNTNVGQ